MRSKYGNKHVVIDGIDFDSESEGGYYEKLKALEKAGEISDLRMQVEYVLIPSVYKDIKVTKQLKTKVKVITVRRCIQRKTSYFADFVYTDNKTGKTVVVDVKSAFTRKHPVYLLKKKMMLAFKGIEIVEVCMAKKKKTTKRELSRPKPSTPRAGFKASGSRYNGGGKLSR